MNDGPSILNKNPVLEIYRLFCQGWNAIKISNKMTLSVYVYAISMATFGTGIEVLLINHGVIHQHNYNDIYTSAILLIITVVAIAVPITHAASKNMTEVYGDHLQFILPLVRPGLIFYRKPKDYVQAFFFILLILIFYTLGSIHRDLAVSLFFLVFFFISVVYFKCYFILRETFNYSGVYTEIEVIVAKIFELNAQTKNTDISERGCAEEHIKKLSNVLKRYYQNTLYNSNYITG